jgi:acetyl esterase/lipase
VVFTLPEMERARVRKDVVYKTVGGRELKADLYYPSESSASRHPAVIFVHGEARPDKMERAKDWGQYVSWGQLAAASGLVGITFTHRSVEGLNRLAEVAGDVEDLIGYVRDHADGLGIDADRLCIWTCSAGGPVGLYAALAQGADYVRCIVAYYAFMDLQHLQQWLGGPIPPEVTSGQRQAFSPLYRMQGSRSVPPMFVVRAGCDGVTQLNESIDRFVAEALNRNVPLTLVNAPEAPHAFDIFTATSWSEDIIRHTLRFMQTHLGGNHS